MRKIRIFEHISLDGMIAPDGDGDYANGGWTAPYRSAAGGEAVAEAQGSTFDLLLGRRTYDIWAGFWPKVEEGSVCGRPERCDEIRRDPQAGQPRMGSGRESRGGHHGGCSRVKSKEGPDLIVWGSSTLTSVLIEQGLVDEVVLIVYPVLLGRGKRFFSDSANPRELALVSTKATSSGVLINSYRHVGSLRTE